MDRLPFKLTVPRELYEDIGHALCQWAHFEQSVNEWLFEVVTDGKAQGQLRKAAFHARLDKLWETVAPQIEPSLSSNCFKRFRKRCMVLKKTRDAIAHGYLAGDDEVAGGALLLSYNYSVLMEVSDVDARSMKRLVSGLSILNLRLLHLKQLQPSSCCLQRAIDAADRGGARRR